MKDFQKIAESQYKALLKEKEELLKQSKRNVEKLAKLEKYFSIMEINSKKIQEEVANAPEPKKRGWRKGVPRGPRKVATASA